MSVRRTAALAAFSVLLASPAWAQQAYVRSTVGAPWGQTANEQAMDLEFGAGNWDDLRLELVDPLVLFSGSYSFVYLEGSDDNATALETFMTANQATIEAWVSGGGALFLNAAPNQGANQNWGFGGITLNYPDFPTNPGTPVDPNHPIYLGPHLPTPVSWTGTDFAHATVSGPGLVELINDANGGNPQLAELFYGGGIVIFGGLTTSNYWTPAAESLNLRANILHHAATGGQPPVDTDYDTWFDFEDNCPNDPNIGQEDFDGDGDGDVCDPCPADATNDGDADGICDGGAYQGVAYIHPQYGLAFGNTSDAAALDLAFGSGNWDLYELETVDVPSALAEHNVLWLDGSDTGDLALETFLITNQVALEDWVASGGALFLNAAPNAGTGLTFGFGGASLTYPDFPTNPGSPTNANHPAWLGPHLPTPLSWTGTDFAHATVTVPGGIPLIEDANGQIHASELQWGAGTVVFGGLTPTEFWVDATESGNLRANLLDYLDRLAVAGGDNCPEIANPTQADSDGDGIGDLCDSCTLGDPVNDPDGDGICESGGGGGSGGAYVHSNVGIPWGNPTDGAAMDLAFGAGAWDEAFFETVDVGTLFSSYSTVWLEGGDYNALELEAFLGANQVAIEDFVANGGALFLNSAPNEGYGMSFGFGGISLNYSNSATDPGTALDPAHPGWTGPFQPTVTSWTGSSFGHADITGPYDTALMDDANGDIYLAELSWGSGTVLFGGLTPTEYWSPELETLNIRANLLAYLDGQSGGGDNCPNDSNPGQEDADGDGLGDVCDVCPLDPDDDLDGDGFCGDVDNCPGVPNPTQVDTDGDGVGDDCDDICLADPLGDSDGDGVCGSVDLCPNTPDPAQVDTDADGVGDACDTCLTDPDNDLDYDGICGDVDNCPAVANATQTDGDGDGLGDACDPCPADLDNDVDGDTLCAAVDLCPNDPDPTNGDSDGDGIGNVCDICPLDPLDDADGDAVCGNNDVCPLDYDPAQTDGDGDGVGDLCDDCLADPDNDFDDDGFCGDVDNCPNDANPAQSDTDADLLGDACDACPFDADNDVDGDTVCGDIDNCPTDANTDQADADSDGEGDVCDATPNGTGTGTATGATGTATGATGTATGATGTATGATGTGTGSEPIDPDEKGGCGCTSAPTPGGGLALLPLLGLLALRRRQ